MIRVIFNDGIMERMPLEIQEHLPAGDKLTCELWRRINDEAMWLASVQADTGMVAVYIYRVKDEEDPWFRDDRYCTPYGERICSGLASRLMDEISMVWWLPGQMKQWAYRTANIKPKEDCYHD